MLFPVWVPNGETLLLKAETMKRNIVCFQSGTNFVMRLKHYAKEKTQFAFK